MPLTAALDERGLRRVLVVLCLTQIVGWGVLYYAFPVLAPSVAGDTGWSVATVTAAFSAGLVVSAIVGIWTGRVLDRIGPRPVMTVGSVLAVPAVVGVAFAPTLPLFVAAWLVAGVAMSATLYPPAFAALTRWWGPRRVTALTAVTMLGGLAGTVFAPLSATLLDHLGWRHTYLVLAVVLAVVTIPAHAIGLRGPWPAAARTGTSDDDTGAPRTIARSRPFVLIVVAVALGTFTSFAVLVNQVPLLIERGLSTHAAAWALGLAGVAQLVGRLGYRRMTGRLTPRTRAVVILLAAAATTALLGLVPGPTALLFGASLLMGVSRGVVTLLQATAVSDRWGATHYGRLNGIVSAPVTVATALAPWAGAALAGVFGGYPPVFVLLAGCAVLGAVLALGTAAPVPDHA
ncbi:MFS transporter [Pseudonocardia sulfidoxydans NBRC 16205]|uniref:MFS transporter n=1 Tax=Pseudonocardia sulfidoxydans NBRC 16205 TaxID=1223511 RepID=A0A511DDK2_9PSEU|nr:MFS transporter [Pseudonocardia sulfidoxydans]GEL22890.1 MFS transporter [Pseudonocardia sulfidoxydans NBRC 16205]